MKSEECKESPFSCWLLVTRIGFVQTLKRSRNTLNNPKEVSLHASLFTVHCHYLEYHQPKNGLKKGVTAQAQVFLKEPRLDFPHIEDGGFPR